MFVTMKRIVLLIFLFGSLPSIAQTSPYKYLQINNAEVVFERIYALDNYSKEKIGEMLSKSVPKVSGFSEYRRDGDVITGRLNDVVIDYRKHGHTWSTAPVILNDPITCNVTVEWKDNKYKVTVSGIAFKERTLGNTDMALKSFLTRKRGTEWKEGHNVKLIGEYTEEYLNGIFTFTSNDNW